MPNSRHMPFRQTIAAKIFGLAIILLLLTIALASFLLYEVTRTTEDLTVVANFDVPLTESVARLDEFGLRRRLAFERWFGALNAAEPNREVIAEASENYSLFTRKTTDDLLPRGASLTPIRITLPAVKRSPRWRRF